MRRFKAFSFLILSFFGFSHVLTADYKGYVDYEKSQYSKVINFDFNDLQSFLSKRKFLNADDFSRQLLSEYPSFLDSFLVIVDSESRQSASVTHPRIVYFSKDNEVVWSISGRPIDTEGEELDILRNEGSLDPPFYDTIEVIYEDPLKKDGTLKFQTIDFEAKTRRPILKENNSCMECHSHTEKVLSKSTEHEISQSISFIWANYAYWPGALPEQDPGTRDFSFYETTAIGQFIGSNENNLARYSHLKNYLSASTKNSSSAEEDSDLSSDLKAFELLLAPAEQRASEMQPKARRLAQMSQTFLYAANKKSLKRLAHEMRRQPDYEKAKYAVLAVLMHCDQGNKKHITEYFNEISKEASTQLSNLESTLFDTQLPFTDFANPRGRRSEGELFKRLARLDLPYVPTTVRLQWFIKYKWNINLAKYSNHPVRETLMFWDGFTGLAHLALHMQDDFKEYDFLQSPVFQGGLFPTLTKGYLPSEATYDEVKKVFTHVDLSMVGNRDSLYDLSSHENMCSELIEKAKGTYRTQK